MVQDDLNDGALPPPQHSYLVVSFACYCSRPRRNDCHDSFAESEKPGGLFLTQVTNVRAAGSSTMVSIVENFLASCASIKIECIWSWQIQCRRTVFFPPLLLGTR